MSEETSVLQQLDDTLWVIDHPFRMMGIPVGTRTTLVRLSDGGLFMHSPGPLTPRLAKQIDELGPVRCIVAPNMFHHLFLPENARNWQGATVHVAPGLAAKRKDLSFDEELGDGPSPIWAGDLGQVWVHGSGQVNEVAFHHPASRTLILTDLAFNVRHSASRPLRVFLKTMGVYGRFGPSRMVRWAHRDRDALRASIDKILAWDFERVIVAHGEVLERGGREALRAGYDWLLGTPG